MISFRPRILIVEDEHILARGLRSQLEALGYAVASHVTTGLEAIHDAESLRPDLVLMDIRLDGPMDGVEAASEIRRKSRVPLIFLTAYSTHDIIERAKFVEPSGYLLKPYQDKELHVAIEMALHKGLSDRKSEARIRELDATLTSIGNAIIATDIDGKVTFMNPAAESLTGRMFEQARNSPIEELLRLLDGHTRAKVEPAVCRAMRERVHFPLANPAILVADDDTEYPIEDCATSILDEDEKLIGGVMVLREVADRIPVPPDILRLKTTALMARGMAREVTDFCGFLRGFSELLNCTLPPDDARREHLADIMNAAQPVASSARQLLAYCSKDTYPASDAGES